jgi:hypothetical protein
MNCDSFFHRIPQTHRADDLGLFKGREITTAQKLVM